MSPPDSPLEPEALLDHASFVRSLARSLVGTDHADDVAQETWAAALANPPKRGGDVRPWLRVVARNIATSFRRSNSRRERRERYVAVTASVSTDESTSARVARRDILRRIAAAVDALPEPYGSVLILRHYEGLSFEEVGRRLGVPVETARTWNRRALDRMRAVLTAQDRPGKSWAVAIGPLVNMPATAMGTSFATGASPPSVAFKFVLGGLGMKWVVPLGLSVLVLFGGFVFLRNTTAIPAVTSVTTTIVEGGPEELPSDPVFVTSDGEAVGEAAQRVIASSPRKGPPKESSDPRPMVLRGRFLDERGFAVRGVEIRFRGSVDERRVGIHPRRYSWEDLISTSDQEGRFEFRFDAPPSYQFSMRADPEGYVPVAWSWEYMVGGEVTAGDVVLERGATIEGQLLDQHGLPLDRSWTVSVRGEKPRSAIGEDWWGEKGHVRRAVSVGVSGDPGQSSFRIEHAPAGKVRLLARGEGRVEPGVVELQVEGGATCIQDIVLSGSPEVTLTDRVTVKVESNDAAAVMPRAEHVRLIVSGEARMATQERFGRGRYVFDGVPDGSWDLVIDDPNYERVHIPDVSPSSPPFVVAMRGRAALTLHVTNGKTGEAIEDFAARFSVRFTDGSHFSPNSFWIRMIGDPGTHMETVDGIVPGDYLLTVDVEGMPKNTIPVLGLAAGEVRSINARMFAGGAITGQVFLGDGVTSAVGATIGLYRPAMIDDGPLSPYVAPRPYQGTKPTAREWSHGRFIEDRGDFRFEGLSPGRYIARAYQSESISIATGVLEITAEETYELSLSLPPSATLSGRVLGPAEASFEGLRLVVRNPSDAKKVHADGVIQDDGSFVVSALPLGIHEVVLAGPDFKVPIGERSSSGLDGYRRDFGMVDVDEGGAHEVFDLREDFPVRNDVLVRQSGVPTPGLIAVARVPAVDGRGAGTFGLTDQHGRVRLGPLPPGEVMLWIADPNAAWSSGPIPFQIAPGRADPFVVDVTLLENRIRCLRSSGAVLRHEEVWYDVSYAGMSTSRSLKTDEEGFVSISAPEGVVGLILPNYRGDPTLIPWTRAGPPAIEVRLP